MIRGTLKRSVPFFLFLTSLSQTPDESWLFHIESHEDNDVIMKKYDLQNTGGYVISICGKMRSAIQRNVDLIMEYSLL